MSRHGDLSILLSGEAQRYVKTRTRNHWKLRYSDGQNLNSLAMKILLLALAGLWATIVEGQQQAATIYFDFDRAELTADSRKRLDSIAVKDNSFWHTGRVTLAGHADPTGSNEYNLQLSTRRIETVKAYFIRKGVPAESFVENPFGETKPLVNESLQSTHALERRVEIIFQDEQAVIPDEDVVATPRKISEQIADTALKAGSSIVLRNIQFMGGTHRMLSTSNWAVDELLVALQSNPGLEIEIQGHICCVDGPADGLDHETGGLNLSHNRAKAVAEYLIAKGIADTRIKYKGFGHSQPLYPYPEQSETERILNRRVEIKILKK